MREPTEPNKPTVIPQEDWIELKELSRHASQLLGELAQSTQDMENSWQFDAQQLEDQESRVAFNLQDMLSTYSRANKVMSSVKDKWEQQKYSIIQNFKG